MIKAGQRQQGYNTSLAIAACIYVDVDMKAMKNNQIQLAWCDALQYQPVHAALVPVVDFIVEKRITT